MVFLAALQPTAGRFFSSRPPQCGVLGTRDVKLFQTYAVFHVGLGRRALAAAPVLKPYRFAKTALSNSGSHHHSLTTITATAAPLLATENLDDGDNLLTLQDTSESVPSQFKPKSFRNRFLNLVRLSSVLNDTAESFFKSEIRRRLFVTAVLIVMSRLGYFIPLPGFDRRLIPQDYLSFGSASAGELLIFVIRFIL